MRKLISLLIGVSILLETVVSASVLGEPGPSWYNTIGTNTNLYSNSFMDANVGAQQEHYIEYVPNKNITPIVVNGESIWGKRTLSQAKAYMEKNGFIPVAGINADYFSLKTGIPMGHTIINGELVCKDIAGQNGVGFYPDGRAFISFLEPRATIFSGNTSVNLECINKWCQPGSVPFYLLSDFFGSETKTESDCYFAILKRESGSLAIGKTITFTVEEKFSYNGSVAIPDDRYVLCLDKSSTDLALVEFMNSLSIGASVSVAASALYDADKWSEAAYATSSVGGRLIENGVVNTNLSGGTSPRTAVGIKADGSVIFYTIDGRQPAYSYGVRLVTLAKRLAELGCVDAINLDGGGSTILGADLTDADFSVINRPSDGGERYCANYLFLKNNSKPTGIAATITGSFSANNNYLSPTTADLGKIGVLDTAGFEMDVQNLSFSIKNTYSAESTVSDGIVNLVGQGESIVTISANGISREVSLFTYTTPDDILVYPKTGAQELTSLSFSTGDGYSADLFAEAYLNSAYLNCTDRSFNWSVEGDIGSITADGVFTLKSDKAAEGAIVVSAGTYVHKIPVSVVGEPVKISFSDMSGHWAAPDVSELAELGIVNGMEENGGVYFHPEQSINRIQFAVMLCKMMGISTAEHTNMPLVFTDAADFDPWMEPYAKAAYANGFVKGRETDGGVMFDPRSNITRAEAMVMLSRLTDKGAIGALTFADTGDIPAWSHDAVSRMVNLGIVSGYDDGRLLPNNNIKRAEAAAMVLRFYKRK